MKKILFLHDPLSAVPELLLSTLVNLALADRSYVKVLLVGRLYFYGNIPYYGEPNIPVTGPTPAILPETSDLKAEMVQTEQQQLHEGLRELETTFTAAGIKYSCSEGVVSLEEILKRSVYADLIVADALLNVPGPFHPSLNVSIRELLADAHCPVLLLREGIIPPERIVLSYDGSYSSMQAIRSFSYLFPDLRAIPCYAVYVTGDRKQKEPAELAHLKDWLEFHFDRATVEILPGEPADVLPAFTNRSSGSALVVMGAYGRSALSRVFRHSLANSILDRANASLFITHEH